MRIWVEICALWPGGRPAEVFERVVCFNPAIFQPRGINNWIITYFMIVSVRTKVYSFRYVPVIRNLVLQYAGLRALTDYELALRYFQPSSAINRKRVT